MSKRTLWKKGAFDKREVNPDNYGFLFSVFGFSGNGFSFLPNTRSQASRAASWFWTRLLDPL
jgi:hypothetical protein